MNQESQTLPQAVRDFITPIVSQEQFGRVLGYIDIGKKEGAQIKAGGEHNKELGNGYFVKPTVLTNVNNSMRVAQEEIFGPVVAAIPFKDEYETFFSNNELNPVLSRKSSEVRYAETTLSPAVVCLDTRRAWITGLCTE